MKTRHHLKLLFVAAMTLNSCGSNQSENQASTVKTIVSHDAEIKTFWSRDANASLSLKENKNGFFFEYCVQPSDLGLQTASCEAVMHHSSEEILYFSKQELSEFSAFLKLKKQAAMEDRDDAVKRKDNYNQAAVVSLLTGTGIAIAGLTLPVTLPVAVPLALLGASGITGLYGFSEHNKAKMEKQKISNQANIIDEMSDSSSVINVPFQSLVDTKEALVKMAVEFKSNQ